MNTESLMKQEETDRQDCTLCGLRTPEPPITSTETDGVFCCSGCMHVYTMLQDMDEEQAEELRRQTIALRNNGQQDVAIPENHAEAFFKVDGMHCSTCESFIETLARRRDGIYQGEASYASEMVKIYYDPRQVDAEAIPEMLGGMGYTLSSVDEDREKEQLNEVARLIIGGFFGIIGLLLYILFLYPTYISGEGFVPLTPSEKLFFVSNIFVMTTFVLFYTGFPILRGAWVSLSVGRPNMDLLITIAAASAYLYSLGALLGGSAEVYFDVTMAIVLVVSIGNYYEKRIKSGKKDLLARLTEKKIREARVQRNGGMETIPVSEIEAGDHIVVRSGERIPIDGTIVEGEGIVNEALMTGEPIPVTKNSGDRVLSGTVLTQNAITIEAGDAAQSTIDELLTLMWNIQSSRPGSQRLADRIATYFVPGVIILGMLTFVYHLLNGAGATQALLSSLAVLIVSCPCALGLATPLAIASGVRNALEREIIFKSAAVFEDRADADIVAFDKTGTLTTGRMQLLDRGNDARALKYAALLEQWSSHPVADAISGTTNGHDGKVTNFESSSTGVKGEVEGKTVYVGKPEWLEEQNLRLRPEQRERIGECRNKEQVAVAIGWEGEVKSIVTVGDKLREDSPQLISRLKRQGKKVAIITGDSRKAGEAIQKKLEPDFLFTEAKPDSKSNIIQELRKIGRVAMAGDGSNDAPALAQADLGIAFGDLTAIAAESAHIVIPSEKLQRIPAAFEAMRLTRNRIRQNLGWAFLYNIITIPLAIAGSINPLFAAVAMATSSLLVVGNSSREMNLENRRSYSRS